MSVIMPSPYIGGCYFVLNIRTTTNIIRLSCAHASDCAARQSTSLIVPPSLISMPNNHRQSASRHHYKPAPSCCSSHWFQSNREVLQLQCLAHLGADRRPKNPVAAGARGSVRPEKLDVCAKP